MVLEYIGLFFKEVYFLFFEMAPYLVLGLLISGLLHVFLSKDFVIKHVGGHNLSSVFKAALFGVPLPLCSCGVVPTAVYLKNSGASKPAVTSFLISTPQTGIDSIAATWGMLGPLFAVFKAIAALLMGTAGGIVDFLATGKRYSKAEQQNEDEVFTRKVNTAAAIEYKGFKSKLKEMFNYATFELLDDIAVNFVIGLAIAAVISIVIPDEFFSGSFLSNKFVAMVLMVVIGIPMYICSTSSIPIAVALLAKGVSPGAAYVFLVAGPATNAASLAIISKTLGKNSAIRYVATIVAGSLIFGFLMDTIFTAMGVSPISGALNNIHEEADPGWFTISVSLLLFAALVFLFGRRFRMFALRRKNKSTQAQNADNGDSVRICIQGMDCGHCAASVEQALNTVKGIDKIKINLNDQSATLEGDFSLEEASDAVRKAGYEVAK